MNAPSTCFDCSIQAFLEYVNIFLKYFLNILQNVNSQFCGVVTVVFKLFRIWKLLIEISFPASLNTGTHYPEQFPEIMRKKEARIGIVGQGGERRWTVARQGRPHSR